MAEYVLLNSYSQVFLTSLSLLAFSCKYLFFTSAYSHLVMHLQVDTNLVLPLAMQVEGWHAVCEKHGFYCVFILISCRLSLPLENNYLFFEVIEI
jgi:hypothetical protein